MTEELSYEVVDRLPDGVELRRYPAHAVAEVTVHGSLGGAGNRAFASLFAYISGSNRPRAKVAMTAPVVQQSAGRGERVAMTAPVVQEQSREPGPGSSDEGGAGERSFTVAFVLPADVTEQTAPEPTDDRVRLRTVPPSLAAAIRYSGRWTESGYEKHRDRLLASVSAAGLSPAGAPRWLRFDPPVKPWFLRRNEVVVDVTKPDGTGTSG
ncbi:SOUL family heme-binding protein [Pedococcus sp. NPDC057267]|uniref:SOUL family heme-binding protein n=1 Tax=Pedococcus sp. NPDC057267 TaxID=3346077 RepID=UPI00363CE9C1